MTAARFTPEHAFEDARLVRHAQGGDASAFARLYERYARIVHGLLLSRVPYGEVEDLVQEIFLSAWQRLDSLRDPAAFGGWLGTIARNRATDALRRSEAMDELLRRLPEAYRETLILRLVEGMTGPEIAERTGLTAASVRVNLHRGMKLLREKLES
jgi:RNA polymerase sigma-70 factor, ECF subfamily